MAALGAFVLGAVLVGRAASRPGPERLALDAEAALRRGEPAAARERFRAIDPPDAASLAGEARACLALGLAARAESALIRACERAPAVAEPWLLRLEVLRLEGRTVEAQAVGGRAASAVKSADRRAILRAWTLALLADAPDDLARATLDRWISADPDDLDALAARARRRAEHPRPGDPGRAERVRSLAALVARHPSHVNIREALAAEQAESADADGFRSTLDAWPADARDARYDQLLGRWELDHGDPARAVDALGSALRTLPHDWKARYRLARALGKLDRRPEAAAAALAVARLREALDPATLGPKLESALARPDDPAARRDLADLCDRVGLSTLADAWRREPGGLTSPPPPGKDARTIDGSRPSSTTRRGGRSRRVATREGRSMMFSSLTARRYLRNSPSRRPRLSLEGLEARRLLTISFGPPTRLSSDSHPDQVVLADLNGDGKLDIVTAGNATTYRLGRGDGTFGDENIVPNVVPNVGPETYGVAAGDFNGDGKVDLAVTYWIAGEVGIMLANGDGTFRAPIQYHARAPISIVAADLDGDGKLDLVAGGDGTGDVSVLLNRGDGTFDTERTIHGASGHVAIADLNGDGHPDILVADQVPFHTLLNDGHGHFPGARVFGSNGPEADFQAALIGKIEYADFIAAFDVNGDGHPDVLRYDRRNQQLLAYLGDGRGDLGDPQPVATLQAVAPRVAAADFDGDGKLDLATTDGGVEILPGVGGGFGPLMDLTPLLGRYDHVSLAIGDLNGDGKPDIVTSAYSYDRLVVVLNTSIPPADGLSVVDTAAPEGDLGATTVPVTVRLSAPSAFPVTVHYATEGGTATPGVDYTPVGGTLRFAPGATSATFGVPVVGNLRVDGDRTVGVTLTDPTGGGTLARGTGTLTIRDDERASVLGFRETLVGVDPGADRAFFAVARDDGRSDGVTVDYATAGGDAIAGVDYSPVAGTLRFAPGETVKFLSVPILARSGRSIGVRLSGAVGGVLGMSSTATIRLDGPADAPVAAESVDMVAGRGGLIRVAFSGGLDARTADRASSYVLVNAGRDGRFGTRDDRRVALRAARYDARSQVVTLTPRAATLPAGPTRLRLASSLRDARGRVVHIARRAEFR